MRTLIMKVMCFLTLLIMLINCEKTGLCKDDELQMRRMNYTGNQLNIDGYYFGDVNSSSSLPFANIYYLYRNGLFFTSEAADLDKAESGSIVVDVSNEFGKTIKGAWGVFQVDGSIIEIERWQSSSNGCETTLYERGDILNDSTFVIVLREFRENGKVKRIEEPNSEFYFRPLTQKPDSTNSFIQ